MKRLILLLCVLTLTLLRGYAAPMEEYGEVEHIITDIVETMVEQDASIDAEQIEEDLRELIAHPIDLNHATAEELERLYFLTPEQIDRILLYVYLHPMDNLYELQLVSGLKDYEVKLLVPFLTVSSEPQEDKRTARDLFHYAKHEVGMRLDVRNMEHYEGDPVYASLRYKMSSSDRLQIGATIKRDAGEVFGAKSRYGVYAELNNTGRLKTLVAGDYRAHFGLGLVMNSALPLGKSSYAANLGITQEGLRHYGGNNDDFLRGAGTTVRLGQWNLSAFYSIRMPDTIWRQTAGVNLSFRRDRLRVGLTAVEYWTRDSLPYRSTYYNTNYFRGTRQFSGSISAQYAFHKIMLMGEVATSQNTRWGIAALGGVRYLPVQDVSLMVLGRYYSLTYDAIHASCFGETSRPNDEHGVYVGTEINRLRRWRFSAYTDFFAFKGPKYMIHEASWGYDLYGQATFLVNDRHHMLWRLRAKHKGYDSYRIRYALSDTWGDFTLRSQLDANLCKEDGEELTYGAMVSEQLEYRPSRIPLTAQLRVEGFYVPTWNNRIYSYENDVLYAFSIPSVYGIGARYYLNLRYRISDHYSLYLRASDTWYTKQWAERQSLTSCHKTDLHLMLRISY